MEYQLVMLSMQTTWSSVCDRGQSPIHNYDLAMVHVRPPPELRSNEPISNA